MRQVEMEWRHGPGVMKVHYPECCRDTKRLLHGKAIHCYHCGEFIRWLYEPEDMDYPDCDCPVSGFTVTHQKGCPFYE